MAGERPPMPMITYAPTEMADDWFMGGPDSSPGVGTF
jgi:hypothetical protein